MGNENVSCALESFHSDSQVRDTSLTSLAHPSPIHLLILLQCSCFLSGLSGLRRAENNPVDFSTSQLHALESRPFLLLSDSQLNQWELLCCAMIAGLSVEELQCCICRLSETWLLLHTPPVWLTLPHRCHTV